MFHIVTVHTIEIIIIVGVGGVRSDRYLNGITWVRNIIIRVCLEGITRDGIFQELIHLQTSLLSDRGVQYLGNGVHLPTVKNQNRRCDRPAGTVTNEKF